MASSEGNSKLVPTGKFNCELCSQKSVTSRCLDCKMFMCSDCRISHSQIPACSSHMLEDIDTYKERNKQRLHDVVEGYISLVCECEQGARDLSRYSDNIKMMRRQVLEKIQDSAFQIHDHVTKIHQSLVDQVQTVTSDEQRNIDRKLLLLQKTCSQVVGKTSIIRSVIENDDTRTITEDLFISEVHSDYSRDMPLYEEKIGEMKTPTTLLKVDFQYLEGVEEFLRGAKIIVEQEEKSTVEEVDEYGEDVSVYSEYDDYYDTASIILDGSRPEGTLDGSEIIIENPYPKKMSDLIDSPLILETIHEYNALVRRIANVDQEIWAVMQDGVITVLCPESHEIKHQITIKERDPDPPWWHRFLKEDSNILYDCLMVAECRKNIIMCLGKIHLDPKTSHKKVHHQESDTQLLQIDKHGAVVNKMVCANYSDICCDDNTVFALLPGTPNTVDMFKSDGAEGSSYIHIRTIALETGRTYYRLLATAGVVYVTGLRNEVHRYHIETAHRYTHGNHGSTLPGQLDTPKLCCVDDYGVLLIADSQNHRLQMLDREKQWQIVELPHPVTCPWDGLWLANRGEVWFIDSRTGSGGGGAGKEGIAVQRSVLHRVKLDPKPIVFASPPPSPPPELDE